MHRQLYIGWLTGWGWLATALAAAPAAAQIDWDQFERTARERAAAPDSRSYAAGQLLSEPAGARLAGHGDWIPAASPPAAAAQPTVGSSPGERRLLLGIDDEHAPVVSGMFGYDFWRSYPDGGWANYGLHTGGNLGMPLGRFSQATGIGLQLGGTVGVYDWAGTDYRLANRDQPTTQGFVTYGFFRNPTPDCNWSLAIVQDWMINNNYSVMGEDQTMFQWRHLTGYTFNERLELGVWGAWRGRGDTRTVPYFGDVTWQPHNQLNFFVHQKWHQSLVDTWIWVGVPERDRLVGEGTLGDYLAGAFATLPMADRVALYTMVNYMHQSGSPGPAAAKEDMWNLYVGLAYFLRPQASSGSIRGHRWASRLPVANNGLFLVDTTRTY